LTAGKGADVVSVVKDVAEPLMERLQVLGVTLDTVAATWFQVLVVVITPSKATPYPLLEKIVPRPVQLMPSVLLALLFVPDPMATQTPLA
jgi:hypothetical protein